MSRRRTATAVILSAAVMAIAACGGADRTTSPHAVPMSVDASKTAKVSDTAMANLVFADSMNVAAAGAPVQWSPTGIRGDGRDKFGQAATFSEYQGRYCGVAAYLGNDGGEGLNADANTDYTSSMAAACGSARAYRFYYDGAATPTFSFAPHHWVLNLASLAVGQSMTQGVFYGIQQTNCQRLYFDATFPPASNALITRLADTVNANGATVKRWQIQSQPGHYGMCVTVKPNGSLVNTGVSHYAPFSYVVTEVPAPAPRYP